MYVVRRYDANAVSEFYPTICVTLDGLMTRTCAMSM